MRAVIRQRLVWCLVLVCVLCGTMPAQAQQIPSPPSSLENPEFATGATPIAPQHFPLNYDFTTARQALATTTYPTNYDFASGTLGGWAASDTTYVQVLQDANSVAGSYLVLNNPNQFALSAPFLVPAEAQSLRFD